MATDRNDLPVTVGDIISIPCRVIEAQDDQDFYNLRVLSLEVMPGAGMQLPFDLNSRQVDFVEDLDPPGPLLPVLRDIL